MSIFLSKKDTQYISNIIEKKGVNYVDVNLELTDHIASEVEELLSKNNTISSRDGIKLIFMNYERFHFMNIEEEKTEVIQKRANKEFFRSFLDFFSIPKILFTVTAIFGIRFGLMSGFLYQIEILLITTYIIFIILLITYKRKKIGKGQFLQLNKFAWLASVMIYTLPQMIVQIDITKFDLNVVTGLFTISLLWILVISETYYKNILKLKDRNFIILN